MDTIEGTFSHIHIPVLLNEVLDALQPKAHGRYLDGTVGMGGHASALLARAESAQLCGLDRDTQALEIAGQCLAPWANQVHLVHSRYSAFEEALDTLGWDFLDGALIDIGVSSMQIDTAERGFSFHADGPLDMRMDRDSGEAPVSRLVNRARVEELKDIIDRYGEDPQAGRIARAIVEARVQKPIETTRELAMLVEKAYPAAWRAKSRNHPATRTFQALRMAANDEIGELERFMEAILSRLKPGARLAVITFHSLEDRVVKHAMRAWAQGCICPKYLPVCVCKHQPEALIITPKPLSASADELACNPRAGSAKLRVAEKLALVSTDELEGGVAQDLAARYGLQLANRANCAGHAGIASPVGQAGYASPASPSGYARAGGGGSATDSRESWRKLRKRRERP